MGHRTEGRSRGENVTLSRVWDLGLRLTDPRLEHGVVGVGTGQGSRVLCGTRGRIPNSESYTSQEHSVDLQDEWVRTPRDESPWGTVPQEDTLPRTDEPHTSVGSEVEHSTRYF